MAGLEAETFRRKPRELLDFSHRTAFMTGASGGIGSAIYKRLAGLGCTMIAPPRSELNLADLGSIKSYVEQHGQDLIDIIINCAAINPGKPTFNEMEAELIDEIVRVDLTAPILLIRGLTSHMKEKGWGRIVNIGSVLGEIGRPQRLAYAASKRGLDSVTESFAAEFGQFGILVNSVNPGFVDTKMTHRNLKEEQIAVLLEQVPLGRLIKPDEIAGVVAFLVSRKNTVVTGQSIVVDGGFLSHR